MLLKNKSKTSLSYSIGQVSAHTGLPQSVLRYWETVFPRLKPAKSAGGSRQYSDADIVVIRKIKELLYEKGFTIKGANNLLEKELNFAVSGQDALNGPTDDSVLQQFQTDISSAQKLSKRLKDIIRILEE